MNNGNIIITGTSGFVGGHLAVALARAGYAVYGTYLNSELAPEVVQSAKELLQVDLSDRHSVGMLLERARPRAIVHCAALSSAADCQADPERAKAYNTSATDHLIQLTQELNFTPGLPQLLYTSTDLVFDGTTAPAGGFLESATPVPSTIYARTKAAAEELLLKYPGPKTILRTCLVYGDPIGTRSGFLGWMLQALRSNSQLELFEDEYRTPVAMRDILATVEILLSAPPDSIATTPEVLNLAGSERISRFEFGEQLCKRIGAPRDLLERRSLAAYQGTIPRSADVSLNSDLLTQVLGRSPRTVAEGLAELQL